jgi:uncharacterized protein (TIGR02117 family)
MRKIIRSIGIAAAATLLVAIVSTFLAMRPSDPALFPGRSEEASIPIFVVSHGYHSGLVLPLTDLLHEAQLQRLRVLEEVLQRFSIFEYLELGWGDDGFYHNVRTAADLRAGEALRALFLPGNKSVVHVVGLYNGPRETFPFADIVSISLTQPGFSRLVLKLDQSFASEDKVHAEDLGVGLYGPSEFYKANGNFNLFNVCNHWVARLLAAAGVPTNPLLSTLPKGLFWDLVWRAHAIALPKPEAAR